MNEMNPQKPQNGIDDLLADPFGQGKERPNEMEEAIQQPADSFDPSFFQLDKHTKPKPLIETLPEEDRKRAVQLAAQIDPHNQQSITLYGTQAQSKLINFSSTMLEHVKNKNIGEIGDIISDLMKKLEEVNPEELQNEKQGFFSRLFGRVSNRSMKF